MSTEENASLLGNSNGIVYDNELVSRHSHNDDANSGKKKKDKKKHDNDKKSDSDNDDDDLICSAETTEADMLLLNAAKSKYDIKNHMANERTFFKYLFTGLHIGSIGTLVLTFFPNSDINKLYLVLLIWIVAFTFMFWGLYGYYRRKYLMETGGFKDTQLLNPHMPLIITCIFLFVILCVVIYGVYINSDSNHTLPWKQLLTVDPRAKVIHSGAEKLTQKP